MNAVPDCLLTPTIAPESGSDAASSAGLPDPEAFERELREATEASLEDGSDSGTDPKVGAEDAESVESAPPPPEEMADETPETEIPETPAVPETAIPVVTAEEAVPLVVIEVAEMATTVETGARPPVIETAEKLPKIPTAEAPTGTGTDSNEILEARVGPTGAPEDGAALGDTPHSSMTMDAQTDENEAPEASHSMASRESVATGEDAAPEVAAEPEDAVPEGEAPDVRTSTAATMTTTRSEALVSEIAAPDVAATRIEPGMPATAAPPTATEPTTAPAAARPSTLPADASPQLTYEAVAAPVRVLAREGGGEARIHLSPAELGRVDVTVIVEDGQVRAALAPERPEVCELLQKHVPDLEERLEDLGLGIEDVTVQTGSSREEDPGRNPSDEGTAPDGEVNSTGAAQQVLEERTAYIGPDGVSVWA